MTLAGMVNLDEAALICDLAETYGIYDYRQLPLRTVAVLSAGLRDDARIIKKANNVERVPDMQLQLLAIIADRLVHAKPKESIYYALMGQAPEAEKHDEGDKKTIKGMTFDSPEAFMKARYGGGKDG